MKPKEFFKNLVDSLFVNDKGFSMRKVMGVAAFISTLVFTWVYGGKDNFTYALDAWLIFILSCIGIGTYKDVVKMKVEKSTSNGDTP